MPRIQSYLVGKQLDWELHLQSVAVVVWGCGLECGVVHRQCHMAEGHWELAPMLVRVEGLKYLPIVEEDKLDLPGRSYKWRSESRNAIVAASVDSVFAAAGRLNKVAAYYSYR